MSPLLVVLAVVLSAAAPHRTKVAVLDLRAAAGQQEKVPLLTPVIVAELAKHPELQVISSQEIASALGLARQRQLLGCAEDSCLAEIGGALGVDYLVSSSLGRIGTRYRLDLRLVRASNAGIVASAGDFISGNDDALADATVRLSDLLASDLVRGAAPALQPSAVAEPPAGGVSDKAPGPSHTGAYVAWGAAGALLVGAAAMTAVTFGTFNDVHDHPSDPERASKADTLTWKGPLTDGLWAAGLVTAGVGTYLYLSAAPAGSGGEVSVGGRF